jgi:predicted TIM-barrel fold metal-dependent hydrolase
VKEWIVDKISIIDADAHFNEPAELWSDYLDPEFKWAAPAMKQDNQGRMRPMIGGEVMPFIPIPQLSEGQEKRQGAKNAALRLADMDKEGIDVMALYPTLGLFFFGVKDPRASAALCNAYNRWAHDHCSIAPDRLIAPCVIPQIDPGACVREAEHSLRTLGLSGVLMRPNPIGGRNLDNPAWDDLWSLLEETGQPLILHEGTTQDVPQVGSERFDNFLYRHMVSHPFEQQMALMSLIFGGVLERHPKLNVMVVECGVGWVPYWMDRMDDHQEHWGHASLKLRERPSDYFRRQCFVAAECAETLLPFVVDAFGDDNLCFSTDYPHQDHPFDGVVDEIRKMEGLSDTSKAKILGGNAARLFGLQDRYVAPRLQGEAQHA